MRLKIDLRPIECLPRGWGALVLLLLLTGCAAQPAFLGAPWGEMRPLMMGHSPASASAAHPAVEVDLEVLTPQQAEQLHQGGIQVPRVSPGTADPRAHRDFVELRVTAVGFGITAGGYLLYCEGLPLPVLVPESHVDLGLTSAGALSAAIYPDRDAALTDLAGRGPESKAARYAYYRGAGGALIVPTLFSPASTPRIARTMLEVRAQLAQTVQRELKVLLVTLTGTRVLQGVFSRVMRVGPEPGLRPVSRQEGPGREALTPQQPVSRGAGAASEAASESSIGFEPVASAPKAPEPVGSATVPGTPTAAPGSLAPSPGLVRALTGSNLAPPVVPGPRLPQDIAVSPEVPGALPMRRPISSSPTQNSQLQSDIQYLRNMGAKNIRVNQQQITVRNGQRVGTNRPDLQFDYNARRYHVEYDTPSSGRGPSHQSRATSNDPDAEIILLIVP